MKRAFGACVFVAACVIAGCSGATTNGTDASAGDASTGDGGAPIPDTGTTTPDTGTMASDTGTLAIDAGGGSHVTVDTGTVVDTGSSCAATLAEIGAACGAAGTCSNGFTCQPVSGIVLTTSCQIRCDDPGSACPCGTTCTLHMDKTGMPWHQCDL